MGEAEARTSQPAMLQLHARAAQMLLLLYAMAGRRAVATAAAPPSTGQESDERALLDFKAKAASGASLASWSRNGSGSYCSWEGVRCGGQRHPRRVVALDLQSQGLAGTISPAIGNLTFLRSLNLSLNALRGDIPPTIGSLRRLWYLDLADNSLAGEIPGNISRCVRLEVMDVSGNRGLRGRIPAEIGDMLTVLRVLRLANNSITGTIPASLGNLSRLEDLSLAINHIEGPIPAGIGGNPHLRSLQLSMNNLSGTFPPSLYNLSSLKLLSMAENELHGRLPQDFGTTLGSSMRFFALGGNRFTGAIPTSLTNLSNLQVFDVSVNEFSGVVPSALGRLQQLEWFNLDNNMFQAYSEQDWAFVTSLTNCSALQVLELGWNSRFAGELPNSLANLSTTLQELLIFSNSISGAIPTDIGNLVGLQQLMLGENLLTGAIPVSIGKLTQLNKLFLSYNNLSGSIPSSIGNLTGLVNLIVKANSLEGSIPASMGNLKKLSVLDLSSNNLSGVIPREVMNLPSLSLYLDLSDNLLEGPLPSEVGNFVNLGVLSLSRNRLSGMIPDAISNCVVLEILLMDGNLLQGNIPPVFGDMKGLTLLNLTSNKLNGSIPGDLGDITNLQQLYLAHNNLSGQIPQLLGNQTSLVRLDLSFNNLQGEVPQDGVFQNLTGLSIVGNDKLCGGMPQLHLPKCPDSAARNNKKTTSTLLRIALPTVGAILVLLSVLSLAAFLYRRSMAMAATQQLEENLPPRFTDIELPMVSYDEILKGTDGFSESNLLGQGRYGSVYSGTLKNGRVSVAIKVFNLQQSGSYKSFQTECEALRRVRHRCLVKIITCCSSIDHQGKDFRALVFELMPNGNLDSWIHSDSDLESQRKNAATLTLEQRLDIAVDITDALDYLHNGCHPMIIHCDLKPSNILLTQDMRACVGDFGIARILNEAAKETCVNSNSTIGVRGSIGYVAPGNSICIL
jgi:Leucine-rich repeat (LRR) protein